MKIHQVVRTIRYLLLITLRGFAAQLVMALCPGSSHEGIAETACLREPAGLGGCSMRAYGFVLSARGNNRLEWVTEASFSTAAHAEAPLNLTPYDTDLILRL